MIDDGAVSRRTVLLGLATLAGALAGCADAPTGRTTTIPSSAPAVPPPVITARLAAVEERFGGRVGVSALDLATGVTVGHRADERFLLCSTGKVPTVATVLRRAQDDAGLLDRVVHYPPDRVVTNSPVTGRHAADGMTVAALCEAALTVSDNTAENLLLEQVGGPAAVTAVVRTLGDALTRLDRPEPDLNVTSPGDERDTTTPSAMVGDLRALLLGDALPAAARDRLVAWMTANTTGGAQIRAGVPAGWRVADKTGSGAQGESNDVGVVWAPETERSGARPSDPGGAPVVIAVYTSPTDPRSTAGKAAIAAATRVVVEGLIGR